MRLVIEIDDIESLSKLLWSAGFLAFVSAGGSQKPKEATRAATGNIAFNLVEYTKEEPAQ